MALLTLIDRGGASRTVKARTGVSVMQLARDAGLDEMLALCGGCCVCGTCHVRLEGGPVGAVPETGEHEAALLDSLSYRTSESRLACQIRFNDELNGLVVRIQPEE
jgi:2Fe-2S ferredoxin